MPDEYQVEHLRSALARAHEKRQPLLSRLIQAVRNRLKPFRKKRPLIESLHIQEKEDAA
jgi:hypothetical protein